MESPKQQIISNLKKVIKDLTGLDLTPKLSHPLDERHGDYTTNIAMVLFKDKRLRINDKGYKTPLELAQEITKKLNNSSLIINHYSRIEAVTPGFINFWLSKDYLSTRMIRIIREKEEYGRSNTLKNKKIMIEFTDPNPFKEFHIGHLYNNTVGESICRLLESQKALVWRVCYQGDVGLHVAKTIYGVLRLCHAEQVQDDNLSNRIKFLGQAYALGVKAYEENESAKKEIERINKEIYEENPTIMDIYKKGREWSLEYFDSIYKRLGTKFKRFYFESEAARIGPEVVKKNIDKVFKKSDGAIIFPGEKYGLHNRVFINSLGLPTYEAKDLGLAPTKYKDFPYDLSIIITASEQSDYFKVVLKALSLIEPELARKTKHISHGVVRLPIGKMSSRTGTIITGEWLLDEAKSRIQKNYKEMDEETSEKVAVGAVKYALLKSGIGRDIVFNFKESISLEGNSGPYLQYTFARTQSIFRKASTSVMPNLFRHLASFKKEILKRVQDDKNSIGPEELSILRALHRFPEVVAEAAEKFAPNIICNYLFDLAQKFNLFYQKLPIINPHKGVQSFRLALTTAVGQVIKNGLSFLGIESPQRM